VKVETTELPGVLVIEPRVFNDSRGFFFENYHAKRYAEAGLPERFVQDNHSCSSPGTIRGFHYQFKQPQGKLVRVLRGAMIDVAADIRRGSPTFGRYVAVELSAENRRQLYIPPGFAHAFCVPKETTEVEYKCTDFYLADDQCGVRWDDPTIAMPWPISKPILSEKDLAYEPLRPDRTDLPHFSARRS
jgi:dTDP-4-dehydrorhamnose 3,5-epimerase